MIEYNFTFSMFEITISELDVDVDMYVQYDCHMMENESASTSSANQIYPIFRTKSSKNINSNFIFQQLYVYCVRISVWNFGSLMLVVGWRCLRLSRRVRLFARRRGRLRRAFVWNFKLCSVRSADYFAPRNTRVDASRWFINAFAIHTHAPTRRRGCVMWRNS